MPFVIFFLTLFLPGAVLALYFLPKKQTNLSHFLLYALFLGLASQILITILIATSRQAVGDPRLNSFFISGVFNLLIIILTKAFKISWWQDRLKNLKFLAYDGALLLISLTLVIFVASQVRGSNYFSAGTDQYYWLASAEKFVEKPATATFLLNPFVIHKPTFFLILAPYIPFLEKTVESYQIFILNWTLFHYFILALAIGQLGWLILPYPSLGLLAPLLLFSFHWNNYYILPGAVVPQDTGLILFVLGFILINDSSRYKTNKFFLAPNFIFFLLLYLIHFGILVMFLTIIGIGELIRYLTKIILSIFLKYKKLSHLINQSPTFIDALGWFFIIFVIIRTFIFVTNFITLPSYTLFWTPPPETLTESQRGYLVSYSIWGQPYFPSFGNLIIWPAMVGFILVIYYSLKKNVLSFFYLAIGGGLMFLFLRAPVIPYFLLSANWQSFRYFLFLHTIIAILAIAPFAIFLNWFKQLLPQLSKVIVAAFFIFALPTLFLNIYQQQNSVLLDMVKGRDEEKKLYFNDLKMKLIELLAVARQIKNGKEDILFLATSTGTYVQWAFAPRQIFTPEKKCVKLSDCLINVTESDLAAIITDKNGPAFKEFPVKTEFNYFNLYQKDGVKNS